MLRTGWTPTVTFKKMINILSETENGIGVNATAIPKADGTAGQA